jgi:hypothetical protein
MSVFLGVLIPVVVLVGDLVRNEKSAQISQALRAAETEMSRIEVLREYKDESTIIQDGLMLQKIVGRQGNLLEGRIVVSDKDGDTVLTITKSWVDYE